LVFHNVALPYFLEVSLLARRSKSQTNFPFNTRNLTPCTYKNFGSSYSSNSNADTVAYDLGSDVWAGHFGVVTEKRGTLIKTAFTCFLGFYINDHAFQDLSAFISKMRSVKVGE